MQNDADRRRKICRELANQCLERLNSTGRGSDDHDISSSFHHTMRVAWCHPRFIVQDAALQFQRTLLEKARPLRSNRVGQK